MKLVILAAGLGSRYGGLKQLDSFGPHGNTMAEFSIYDAVRAGFDGVVLIIRREMEGDFRKILTNKIENKIECRYVYQDLGDLPRGSRVPKDRVKPLGTAHALYCCRRELADGPFLIVNADDFYGREAYGIAYDFLRRNAKDDHALVGYSLEETLSEVGYVSRGVCDVTEGRLAKIRELKKVKRADSRVVYEEDGAIHLLENGKIASMNMFAFGRGVFEFLEKYIQGFLDERGADLESESHLPVFVSELVEQGKISVAVLKTNSQWFGVTYEEDKKRVSSHLEKLFREGVYPAKLWD